MLVNFSIAVINSWCLSWVRQLLEGIIGDYSSRGRDRGPASSWQGSVTSGRPGGWSSTLGTHIETTKRKQKGWTGNGMESSDSRSPPPVMYFFQQASPTSPKPPQVDPPAEKQAWDCLRLWETFIEITTCHSFRKWKKDPTVFEESNNAFKMPKHWFLTNESKPNCAG